MDDVYPREGQYFQPTQPEADKQAVSEEVKAAVQARPFLDGVTEWFDEAIANTDSLSTARDEAKRRDVPVDVIVEAYDIVREILINKKGEFESLKQTFK